MGSLWWTSKFFSDQFGQNFVEWKGERGSCSVSVRVDINPRYCFAGLACLAVSKFSVGVEWLWDGLSEYLQFA